ncbi:MAG: hypothetical protein AAGE52_36575 [Myxococcota bacterium]
MKQLALLLALALVACDDGGGGDGTDSGPGGRDSGPGVDAGERDAGPGVDAGGEDGGEEDAGPGRDADPGAPCDYESRAGMIVIEAENLTLSEAWMIGTENAGFTGTGYIEWTDRSFNNDQTNGPISAELRFAEAGLYRLQWHTRIGRGSNPTEHNDVWVRFADAADFYGLDGPSDAEDRVYPRPVCDDDGFMDGIRAMPNVAEATCPNGSTGMGYFKVYSSGARDWRWSAFTSDNDAHDIMIQIDAPGVYTMEIAARADFSQLDRIVIHEVSLDNDTVRNLENEETACP